MATFYATTSDIFASSLKPSLRNNVAKPETVQKVCETVRKQLALPAGTELTSESKFSALGADSLGGNRYEFGGRIWD